MLSAGVSTGFDLNLALRTVVNDLDQFKHGPLEMPCTRYSLSDKFVCQCKI